MNESAIYEIRLKDSFSSGLKTLEKNTDSFETKLKDVGGTIATVFAVDRLVSFGNESLRTAAKMDSMRNAIVFASGSAKEGAENLLFLKDTSDDLGFNLAATTEGFKTFSGALIGSKFEGEKARDIFTKISYGISAMGLDADSAKGAFLALGQMVSKGTVSAEELRGQLGERLPGAFQIAARSLGVTTRQLGDMLKAGEVITEDFLPKFADEMEKTFKGAIGKSAHSLQADLNRVENKLHEFSEGVGFILSPTIHILAAETKSANEQFSEQKIAFDSLSMASRPLRDKYISLKSIVNKTTEEQEDLKRVTTELANLMPSAVTAWDAYGNAIELSTNRMNEHIKYSREAMKVLNADAIRQTEGELLQARKNVISIQNELKETAKTGAFGNWNRDESNAAISWLRGNLEIEQEKQKDLQRKYIALKGGVDIDARDKQLMEGIKKRDLMFSGLKPGSEESLFDKIFEGFSEEAKSSSKTKLKGLFKNLSAADKETKIKDLYSELSGLSASKRIQRINELTAKNGSGTGLEKIQSGTRNVTVNINKLVETITFQKMDGLTQLQVTEMVKRALTTAVNDVNIVSQ